MNTPFIFILVGTLSAVLALCAYILIRRILLKGQYVCTKCQYST